MPNASRNISISFYYVLFTDVSDAGIPVTNRNGMYRLNIFVC